MRALVIGWDASYLHDYLYTRRSDLEPLRGCAAITIEIIATPPAAVEMLEQVRVRKEKWHANCVGSSNSYVVSFKQTHIYCSEYSFKINFQ
jgi:hypothetical protein